jgi:hypothetical protein
MNRHERRKEQVLAKSKVKPMDIIEAFEPLSDDDLAEAVTLIDRLQALIAPVKDPSIAATLTKPLTDLKALTSEVQTIRKGGE